ncbi:MAG: VOC family protein [Agriterribacter sp.]
MKIVPLLRCNNLKKSIIFYTNVLDFTLKYPNEAEDEWVVTIINNDAEILLSGIDGTPRVPILVLVDDVDAIFEKYISRGLVVPNNPDSPVHNSPLDQTWGLREFYVNDPDGNTLRFATPIG